MEANDFELNMDDLLRDYVGPEIIDARSLSHLEEAREAEDLHGILRDLEFAKEAIKTLNEMLEHSNKDDAEPNNASLIRRSLYTAALIAYARCYGKPRKKPSGKRILLDAEQVFVGANVDWMRHHKHFIAVRDKHLAHSVNPFEINRAGLFVEDWDANPPKHVVGILSFHRVSEEAGNVLALVHLAEIAIEHVSDRSRLLLDRLEAQINSLPITSQRALEPYVLEFRQEPEDVSGPR